MSTPTSEAYEWFYCGDCDNKLAPFNGLVKELVSQCNSESSWLLFHENTGLNVKFKGRKTVNLPPASITSIQVADEGRISHTDVANIHCSKCEGHVGWKIIHEHSNDPIIHKGQFILHNSFGRDRLALKL